MRKDLYTLAPVFSNGFPENTTASRQNLNKMTSHEVIRDHLFFFQEGFFSSADRLMPFHLWEQRWGDANFWGDIIRRHYTRAFSGVTLAKQKFCQAALNRTVKAQAEKWRGPFFVRFWFIPFIARTSVSPKPNASISSRVSLKSKNPGFWNYLCDRVVCWSTEADNSQRHNLCIVAFESCPS